MDHALVAIVVHYGEPAVTAACVQSLRAANRPPAVVVACNDGPEGVERLNRLLWGAAEAAGSAATAPANGESIYVLPLGGNLGFGAACNAGLRAAAELPGARYAWILNNDTVVEPEAPELLQHCLEMNPQSLVGTAVVQLYSPERLELVLGCRFSALTTVTKPLLQGITLEQARHMKSPRVDYIYGASLAFSLETANNIGVFDEEYFLYYEEADLCRRAVAAGLSLRWCPEAVVRHAGGHSAGLTHQRPSTARMLSHYHENLSTFIFLRKHSPWALPFAMALRTAAKLILLPIRGQGWLLLSYFMALHDFVVGRRPGPDLERRC